MMPEELTSPKTVGAETGIHESAPMTADREIECLLVLKGRKLVGIVTDRDVRGHRGRLHDTQVKSAVRKAPLRQQPS